MQSIIYTTKTYIYRAQPFILNKLIWSALFNEETYGL